MELFRENDNGQFEPFTPRVKLVRDEWPAIIQIDGTYLEEEYAIDTGEQRFREVSEEYVKRNVDRKR